jgi:hypothetical protein
LELRSYRLHEHWSTVVNWLKTEGWVGGGEERTRRQIGDLAPLGNERRLTSSDEVSAGRHFRCVHSVADHSSFLAAYSPRQR